MVYACVGSYGFLHLGVEGRGQCLMFSSIAHSLIFETGFITELGAHQRSQWPALLLKKKITKIITYYAQGKTASMHNWSIVTIRASPVFQKEFPLLEYQVKQICNNETQSSHSFITEIYIAPEWQVMTILCFVFHTEKNENILSIRNLLGADRHEARQQ